MSKKEQKNNAIDEKTLAAHERSKQRLMLQDSDNEYQNIMERKCLNDALRRVRVMSDPRIIQAKIRARYQTQREEAKYLASLSQKELTELVQCKALIESVRALSTESQSESQTSNSNSQSQSETAQA